MESLILHLRTVLLLFCCTVCTALLFSYSAIYIAASVRNELIVKSTHRETVQCTFYRPDGLPVHLSSVKSLNMNDEIIKTNKLHKNVKLQPLLTKLLKHSSK